MTEIDSPEKHERWEARQRQFYESRATTLALLENPAAGPDQLAPIAHRLANLLLRFHDDSELWLELGRGREDLVELTSQQRVQLQGAMDINWAPFLIDAGYEPPPPAGEYALTFRLDVLRAIENPAGVNLRSLRKRVKTLAHLLEASEAGSRRSRAARLRAAIQRALPALKRGAVVHGVGAVASLGAAALGNLVAPGVGLVAAAAIKGGVSAGLDRAVPRLPEMFVTEDRDRSFDGCKTRFDQLLRPEQVGRIKADIGMVRALQVNRQVDASFDVADRKLREVQQWVDETTAVAFLFWDLAEERGESDVLLEHVGKLANHLVCVAQELADADGDLKRAVLRLEQMTGSQFEVLKYLHPHQG